MLFGGVTLPGRPDLCNVALLDRLPIPFIRQAQRAGFAIDREYFRDLSSRFAAEMVELERDIASYIPPDRLHEFAAASAAVEEEGGDAEFNANSAEQIGKLLFDMLGIGIGKQLKRTKQGARISTGKKQLELLQADHPAIRKVLDYRERAKLKQTYCDGLPGMARFHPRGDCCPTCEWPHTTESWRVHGEIGTTRAETGRLNHKRPNLANVPIRTELGGLIRLGFTAPLGKLLVTRDLSQIELRDLAHCAEASSMIDVYDKGKDIHLHTACSVFNLDYEHYDRLSNKPKAELTLAEKKDFDYFKLYQRMPSKNLNFMTGYGCTVKGLLAQLALSGLYWTEDEGNAFIRQWFNLYPEVRAYMDQQHYRARRYGMVWDLFGRVRLVPEVRSCHSWIRDAGLRQAGNMPIQALAAGQMKIVMGKTAQMIEQFRDAGIQVTGLTSIHDQLILEADEEAAGDVDEAMAWAFDSCMNDEQTGERLFKVPICSDGKVMERWKSD